MLRRSLGLVVYRCTECGAIIVSSSGNDIPLTCNQCGVPWNISLTKEQREQIQKIKNQRS